MRVAGAERQKTKHICSVEIRKGAVPFHQIVATKGGGHYFPSLSMDDAVLEQIALRKLAAEHWSPVLVGELKILNVVLKLCNHRWLPGLLKPYVSGAFSARKLAARDASYSMLGYAEIFSWSNAVRQTALLGKENKWRSRQVLLRNIGNVENYDMFWSRTCRDMK